MKYRLAKSNITDYYNCYKIQVKGLFGWKFIGEYYYTIESGMERLEELKTQFTRKVKA